MTPQKTGPLPEFFFFKEGKTWICAWRRFDLVSQGSTERLAWERMQSTIAASVIWSVEDGSIRKLGSLKRPPPEVVAEWLALHLTYMAPEHRRKARRRR